MAKDNKQIETEQSFINLLLTHKDLASDWIISNLKVIHFDPSHKFILRAIEDSIEKNGEVLTKKTFAAFVKKFSRSDSEVNGQMILFDKISLLSVERGDYSLLHDQIMEKYIKTNSIRYIEDFKNDLETRDGFYAIKKLSEKVSGLTVDTSEKNKIIYEDITNYSNIFLEKVKEKRALGVEGDKGIKCGIKEIDDTLGVGFEAGTLTLFTAPSSSYKSTMMLNIGLNVWDYGFNVLFVPLEMPRKMMYQKALSRQARVSFDRIQRPYMLEDDEMEKLELETKKINEVRNNKFYIMESFEKIPVSVIRRQVEKNIDIFKPDLVIVDYIANLCPEERYQKDTQTKQVSEMITDLRNMGKCGAIHENGFSVVSGAQIGRDALKRIRKTGLQKGGFYQDDIKDSHSYVTDSDNVYVQMKDEAQPNRRLILSILKSRYGATVFSNGESKIALEVMPEISLIKSMEDNWYNDQADEILSKVNNKPKENIEIKSNDNPNKNSIIQPSVVDDFPF